MASTRIIDTLLVGLCLLTCAQATSSPTPSPSSESTSESTIWWANEFLFFTYFELYFIGTAILLGGFLVCFCCCTWFFKETHPLNLAINFMENLQKARAKRSDERFRESKTLLGKGQRSDA